MQPQDQQNQPPLKAAQILRWLAMAEEDGIAFYRGLAGAAESPWLRELAESLMEAEERHRKRFLEYAERAEERHGGTPPPPEHLLPERLVKALSTRVFDPNGGWKIGAEHTSESETLEMAIRLEEHLALLLGRIRPYVPRPERYFISQVIKEEWGHVERLGELLAQQCGVQH